MPKIWTKCPNCEHEFGTTKHNIVTVDRLMGKVLKKPAQEGGCWLWIGHRNGDGYGETGYGGKFRYAHRASYELLIGQIPKNKVIRHRCDNPPCVNPEHLIVGTKKENHTDMITRGRHRMIVTKDAADSRLRGDFSEIRETIQRHVTADFRSSVEELADDLGLSASDIRSYQD